MSCLVKGLHLCLTSFLSSFTAVGLFFHCSVAQILLFLQLSHCSCEKPSLSSQAENPGCPEQKSEDREVIVLFVLSNLQSGLGGKETIQEHVRDIEGRGNCRTVVLLPPFPSQASKG